MASFIHFILFHFFQHHLSPLCPLCPLPLPPPRPRPTHTARRWLLLGQCTWPCYIMIGVRYFPKILKSTFIMKFNERKFFHLNLEFRKSDYQTFERQHIFSLKEKISICFFSTNIECLVCARPCVQCRICRYEQKQCLSYSAVLVSFYYIQISKIKIMFRHWGNW